MIDALRGTLFVLALSAAGCAGAPPAVTEPRAVETSEPEVVAVDWLGRGRHFAARVVDRRHGLIGVQYADGDREWAPPERVGPLPELTGRTIQVYARGSAHAATVIERRETLFHVRLADGADTWVDATMLYTIDEEPSAATQPPPPAPVFAQRRGVDPTLVRPGARVLAYWISGEAPQLSQPWICLVRGVHGGQADLLYSDGSEATVPLELVLHVFPARVGRVRAGDRVWVRTDNAVGWVFERAGRLVKIGSSPDEQSWMEATEIIARVGPVDRDRVVQGAHVTVSWNGSPYHATVTARDGESATVQWHDGSSPATVSIDEILEVWEAR